jgi:hypothetical protein
MLYLYSSHSAVRTAEEKLEIHRATEMPRAGLHPVV